MCQAKQEHLLKVAQCQSFSEAVLLDLALQLLSCVYQTSQLSMKIAPIEQLAHQS